MKQEPLEATIPLYQRVLGECFETLPGSLREFHSAPAGGRARGELRVTRGPGLGCSIAAALLRFPRPAHRVQVELAVTPRGSTERWARTFGNRTLVTEQKEWRGLLTESTGLLRVGMRVTCSEAGMEFTTERAWIGRLPLPLLLAPKARGVTHGTPGGWRLEVTLTVPGLGTLMRYEGEMRPVC